MLIIVVYIIYIKMRSDLKIIETMKLC